LESELGFEQGELVSLWQQAPQISEDEINSTKDRVWKLVNYISELGHERLELQKAHQRDQQRLRESEALERAARDLSGLTSEWDEFWGKVSQVLEQMTEVIDASCGMVVVSESATGPQGKGDVKAIARLPAEHFQERVYSYDEVFRKVVEESEIVTVPYGRHCDPNTIYGSIRQFAPSLATELDEVVLVPVRLGDEQVGTMLFFLSKGQDISGSVPILEKKGLLVQLASLIGVAYQNCRLYQVRQREIGLRRAWLEQVTHQLLAPLHGLQGYAENLWKRLQRWEAQSPQHFASWTEEEIRWWKYSLESMVWSSHYASRLAMNLVWPVYSDKQHERLDLEVVEDVGSLLIACARSFQGIAEQKRLRKVTVKLHSVACLNGRLRASKDLLRQAVGNLLDNAVKYANPGTDVLIEGGIVGDRAEIRVINDGIRLYSEEVELILRDGYRGREARMRYPTGTGIGLTVARQIIELHGGTLTARPSEQTSRGWQTTFVISLPIHPKGCR
jgi:signal transduction histidine kinase